MPVLWFRAAFGALAFALAATAASRADTRDYEFQLVTPEVKAANSAAVEVRLINKRTGQPVSDAVIFTRRLDMAPDGMAAMSVPVEAIPAAAPGHYRFRVNFTMEGSWQLSLAAKVQGETGTVVGRLLLKAVN